MKMQGGVSVPWFTAETWPELLKVADDRADLPDSHAEFEQIAGRKFKAFAARGIPVVKVLIDIPELVAWCWANRCPIDGPGRAGFAAFSAMRRANAH